MLVAVVQILPTDPCRKPQGKHLQTRADYLLKLLKKELDSSDTSKAAEEVCVCVCVCVCVRSSTPVPSDALDSLLFVNSCVRAR